MISPLSTNSKFIASILYSIGNQPRLVLNTQFWLTKPTLTLIKEQDAEPINKLR